MIRSNTLLRRALLSTSTRTARFAAKQTANAIFPPTTKTHLNTFSPSLKARYFRTTAAMSSKGGVHNLSNKKEFDAALDEKDTLMVLDCFATWCGPCKVIAPKVLEMSNTYTNAHFFKIDVDEVPDVAQELGIRAMPTFLLFKNGERVGEVVGANPKALDAAIQGNL